MSEASTRELRIDQVIADYLKACEDGAEPDDEAWLAEHADIAAELREFLADHRQAQTATRLGEDLAPAERGEVFGAYELLEELGRGGMGRVYRARQRGLDRDVALKMISSGRLAGEGEVRRFRKEAELAAQLDHPNIVTVHDVDAHDDRHYFTMALVEGQDLAQRLGEGPLPPRQAATIVAAVARAIDHAHGKGVLHRDLKPSNVLLDADGVPRVTDFGLARRMGDDATRLTATGAMMGTLSYMAPEQLSGRREEVTKATDVYGLGAVLYQCVTSQPPYTGDQVDVIARIRAGELTSPRAHNPELPAELEAICLRAMAHDPVKRYDSAGALAQDLQNFVEGKPILAQPPGPLERAWSWSKRRVPGTRFSTAASNVGLVLGLLGWLVLWKGGKVGLPLLSEKPEFNAVAGVAALMAIWWLTEAIPLAATALVPLILFPALGIMDAEETAAAYGHDIIFLFLGGFLLAIALEDSGLPRRLALRIVAALGGNPRRIVLSFMLAAGLLSMWISNSAVTIMLLPIGAGLLKQLDDDGVDTRALGAAVMLGIAYAASIAGTATPVGSPVNVAALSQFGKIPFLHWMGLGLPFTVLQLGLSWYLLAYRIFPLSGEAVPGARATAQGALTRLGLMKPAELRSLLIFGATALLWITREPDQGWGWGPTYFGTVVGQNTISMVGDGAVAVIMAMLCFVVPSGGKERRRLLRWEATVRLPWGVLFLFGGGLALSAGMKKVGLLTALGDTIGALLQSVSSGPLVSVVAVTVILAVVALYADRRAHGGWVWKRAAIPYSAVAVVICVLLLLGENVGRLLLIFGSVTFATEIFINLTTVQLLIAPLVKAAPHAGLAKAQLVIGTTMAASCAFLLPVSTTPNAVVYSSDRVKVREMVRAGLWLNVISVLLITALVALYSRLWG